MKQEIFEQLKRELCACRLCEGKFDHEPRAIFQGAQDANIMQISQAPSIHVHNSGLPFHDASGKSCAGNGIKSMMHSFMMSITSISLPWDTAIRGKGKQGDKKPPRICARTWLMRELDAVDNQLYIIIGAMAAKELFPERSFEELVFHDQQLRGKPALVLPHPSPLNVRWMKEHPQFEADRLLHIRKLIHRALQL